MAFILITKYLHQIFFKNELFYHQFNQKWIVILNIYQFYFSVEKVVLIGFSVFLLNKKIKNG
ncbi:MAG: hypothetical protein BWY08_02265 [Bacteroidetes bacterium ADurb.Bin174]|nr:MAG: hypothetical protein BWY08_02265 [Bacteroidetes bacterium ADurb.Bin174]